MTAAKTRLAGLALSVIVGAGIAAYRLSAPRRERARSSRAGSRPISSSSAPTRSGRVETLAVREGDAVAAGAPLFALDADLQRAAVAENEAAVANAKHHLRARAGAAEEGGRLAEGVRRCGSRRCARPRRGSTRRKTRLDRRRVVSPAAGTIQEVYFRVGRDGAGRPADRVAAAAGQRQACASSCRRRCCRRCTSAIAIAVQLRRLREAISWRASASSRRRPSSRRPSSTARRSARGWCSASRRCPSGPRTCASASRSPSPCSRRAGASHARK